LVLPLGVELIMGRVILHVDLDAFYASVEEREDPSIRGKAVAVCMFSARGGDSGAIAAANYAARSLGVHSGMAIAQSKKLAPDAVYLPARRKFYKEVSEKVMKIFRGYADSFEQVSIDEAFLDVSESAGIDFNRGKEIARQIKKEVKDKEGLACSVGIGPNKLIAKMASSVEKPDGMTVISPGEVESFLRPLDVTGLWGVGGKTKKGLADIHVETIGGLTGVGLPRLIEIFGKSKGRWLYNAAQGVDEEPVSERGPREQIGRISTLVEDTSDVGQIASKIDELALEVFEQINKRGVLFRTVTLFAVTTDLKGHSKGKTLPAPANSLEAIQNTGRELINRFLAENDLLVRRAGITVSNFSKPTGQKTLHQYE
jgi:DNA polymerase IV (DinB-like DNA polymerase)